MPVQLSPEATPHPLQVQAAPAGVAPVAQLPLAPIAVNPAGHGWVPAAIKQIFVALGAHWPDGHVAAPDASGQKFIDVCQTESGAVAPVGLQFGHTLPSQGQDVPSEQALNDAGWLAEIWVAMSDPIPQAAVHCISPKTVVFPVLSGKLMLKLMKHEPVTGEEQPQPEAQPTLTPV